MAGKNRPLPASLRLALALLAVLFFVHPARALWAQSAPSKDQEILGLPPNPADQAQITLRKLRQCQTDVDAPFEPVCAIKVYKEAGQILEAGGVTEHDAPHLWWFIYEGIGITVAQGGRLPEAREFFQKAGRIERIPEDAREESAYFLAVTDYRLGNKEDAWHAFDTLFSRNSRWLEHAESDPAIADLRKEPEWKELAERHRRRLRGEEVETPQSPPESSKEK